MSKASASASVKPDAFVLPTLLSGCLVAAGRVFPARKARHFTLPHLIFGPLLAKRFGAESVDFYFGAGDSWASDACGLLACWATFYVGVNLFYFTAAPLSRWHHARKYPKAPTSAVAQPLVANMIEVSARAFPLYVTMPMLGDFFRVKGWDRTCDSLDACGGWAGALGGCALYFAALEVLIFFDHYYLLHKSDLGKRIGQHAQHHVYKYADQLNAYSGFSFAPQDGWSQGLPLAVCTLFIRVPLPFVWAMEVLTACWTLYIHTDTTPLPWPLMGCDYHYIHHKYNWYNFGFMTLTMDTLFRTAKHPKDDALALSHGRLPMPITELEKSAALTEALLRARGAADMDSLLRADRARGGPAGQSSATKGAAVPVPSPQTATRSRRSATNSKQC